MFDAGKGFFHFVFANQDDDYYTAAYVKMGFKSYIRHGLINSGFQHIFILGKDKCKPYWLECTDTASGQLGPVKQDKGMLGLFKSNGSKKSGKTDTKLDWKHMNINDLGQMRHYLSDVFGFMFKNKFAAVVIPIDLFVSLTEENDLVEKLTCLKNESKHNIFVITSSVKASDNDKYFRNTKYEYGYEGRNQNKCSEIFYNPNLFPELVKKLNADMTKVPKLVFLYDMLKDCFKERMQVWNELSYERILAAVNYTIMRLPSKSMKNIIPPKTYAAIIYIWYGNQFFREKYSYLDFPENKCHCLAEITEMVRQSLLADVAHIERAIVREGADNIQGFIKRWPCSNTLVIAADSKYGTGDHGPVMLELLIWYKNILKGHEGCLGEEELCDVYDMICQFSKPFFQSANNKAPLPHERFNESKNTFFFNMLLKELEQKAEWNIWDNKIAKLLYILFSICYAEGMSMGGSQVFNQLGNLKFDRCKEGLKICKNNSQKHLFDIQEAERFEKNIISALAGDY